MSSRPVTMLPSVTAFLPWRIRIEKRSNLIRPRIITRLQDSWSSFTTRRQSICCISRATNPKLLKHTGNHPDLYRDANHLRAAEKTDPDRGSRLNNESELCWAFAHTVYRIDWSKRTAAAKPGQLSLNCAKRSAGQYPGAAIWSRFGFPESNFRSSYSRQRGYCDKCLRNSKQLLLSTDMPIDEISTMIGYYTPNSFRRKFKQETGFTPSQFRETQKDNTQSLWFSNCKKWRQVPTCLHFLFCLFEWILIRGCWHIQWEIMMNSRPMSFQGFPEFLITYSHKTCSFQTRINMQKALPGGRALKVLTICQDVWSIPTALYTILADWSAKIKKKWCIHTNFLLFWRKDGNLSFVWPLVCAVMRSDFITC